MLQLKIKRNPPQPGRVKVARTPLVNHRQPRPASLLRRNGSLSIPRLLGRVGLEYSPNRPRLCATSTESLVFNGSRRNQVRTVEDPFGCVQGLDPSPAPPNPHGLPSFVRI